MKLPLPKVSIIIVNYNQPLVTCECLNSLREVNYRNKEIFVVDNGSLPENRVNVIDYPEVNFIQSERNLGFAGGNNLAIEQSNGDYILLLNNDTEVPSDFIEPLLNTFVEYPDAGIVSPKIIFYNENRLIQYAGTEAINPFTCRGHTIGYKEKDEGQHNHLMKTDLAHGACMMIKREVVNKIGKLCEDFFLYYEEYDYCEMAKNAGFTIYFNGFSHILHKESVSVGRFSPLKSYYMAKNRVLFARRNFKGVKKLISLIYYFTLAFPKKVITESLSGHSKNSVATIKGAFRNFRPL